MIKFNKFNVFLYCEKNIKYNLLNTKIENYFYINGVCSYSLLTTSEQDFILYLDDIAMNFTLNIKFKLFKYSIKY